MTRSPTLPFLVPLLAAFVLGLLLLATLQFYWVGQVSEGERARMRANLELGARRFAEDFDRELARLYLTLQMDAATLRTDDWERYARRYDSWLRSTPYPELVADIYLAEVNQIGRLRIRRFDPSTRRFVEASWTPDLVTLRRRFERAYRTTLRDTGTTGQGVAVVAAEVPALAIEVSRSWLLSDRQDLGINADLLFSELMLHGNDRNCVRCASADAAEPLFAHTIVVLDKAYVQENLLPTLAERYFPASSSLDFNLAVVSRGERPALVYGSDQRLKTEDFAVGDAAQPLFDVSYADLNQLLLDGNYQSPSVDEQDEYERIAIGVLDLSTARRAAGAAEDSGAWQLVVKHRAGSLEAATAGLRLRYLALSFGTLLLLAGSAAFLLLSARRAQRLAQQQIAFASAVSHELRSPLAVICSAGENLADGVVDDAQRARQYGSVIYNEGRRLTDMIEQVLAFAATQSGQRAYRLQPMDVVELVESALATALPQTHPQPVDVQISRPLPLIEGDAIALRRAVQNLLSNALKYGRPPFCVTVDLVYIDYASEIRISVADHGPGIPSADLEYLFDPFYRGSNAIAAQAPGSGLGLHLVKHTVEAHGGRVSVTTAPGSGICFILHLPVRGDTYAWPVHGPASI
jgi:signal transduction histidine kinase